MGCCTDTCQGFNRLHVELSRICLAGNAKNIAKSKLCRDKLVEFPNFFVVVLKEFKKGGLGAYRAFCAACLYL